MRKVGGNSVTVGFGSGGQPIATSAAGLGGYPAGGGAVAIDATKPAVNASAKLPLGNTGKSVPVNITAGISKASIAKGMVEAIKSAAPIGGNIVGGVIGGVAVSAVSALIDYGFSGLRIDEVGELIADDPSLPVPDYAVSDGYMWRLEGWFLASGPPTGYIYNSQEDALSAAEANCLAMVPGSFVSCGRGVQASTGKMGVYGLTSTNKQYYRVTAQGGASSCPVGWYVVGGVCSEMQPQGGQLSGQQLIDAIAHASGWPTSAAIATAGIWDGTAPDVVLDISPETVEVTGPATVPGAQKVESTQTRVKPGTTEEVKPDYQGQTEPATKQTTKAETHNVAYEGNKVTYNTTTNTVTNITNNVTNQTTNIENKTETTENDAPEDEPVVDSPLPEIPTLYERKYPDGMVGIWNTKSQLLKESSLSTFSASLMPIGYTSGICPSWQLDLSFAQWADMGTVLVEPPCWIWDVAKTIIVISALLLARSLIFGG